jgi:hypothetical protein
MTTALANRQGQLAPLKDVDPKQVLERYLAEETGPQIAASYGVTKAALSYFMLKYAEDEWKSAQLVKALMRKDRAEEMMERADNSLDLARARELLKAAQWDLERVCRRIYGQETQVNVAQIAVQIGVQLRGSETTADLPTAQVLDPA